ncbi:MAG: hypothetical protein FDZ75_03930 [Actinobacteria bacterium]|nr:MAG: hypothetical protein FDZ75_03930 [Actinomycetota bacterium]
MKSSRYALEPEKRSGSVPSPVRSGTALAVSTGGAWTWPAHSHQEVGMGRSMVFWAIALVAVCAVGLRIDASLGGARTERSRAESGTPTNQSTSADAKPIEATATAPLAAVTPDPGFRTTHPTPYSWVARGWIAHGLGGVGGKRVTNSLEAFEYNYARGYRVFEVDLVPSTDGTLVARHDWQAYLYEFLGQKVDNPYRRLSTAEFKSLKMHGTYTPLTVDDVMALMRAYPDVWLMTDTKGTTPADAQSAMRELVRAMGEDHVLAERIIVQIYNEQMLDAVNSVYPFRNIVYTLYQTQSSPEQALAFARDSGIRVVALPIGMWTPALSGQAGGGVSLAVYTTNDRAEADRLRGGGVALLYSDFLPPDTK